MDYYYHCQLLMHFTTVADNKNRHDIATIYSRVDGNTQYAIEDTDIFMKAFNGAKTMFPKSSLMCLFLLAASSPSLKVKIKESDRKEAADAIKSYDPTLAIPLPKGSFMQTVGSEQSVLTIFPNDGKDNRRKKAMDLTIVLDTIRADVSQLYRQYQNLKEFNEKEEETVCLKDIEMQSRIKTEINLWHASADEISLLSATTEAANDEIGVILNGSSKCVLSSILTW